MASDLCNLPSSGVLVNPSNIRWSLQPSSHFVLSTTSHSPDQVLERDNTTETLVRILRQQQQDPAAAAAAKARPTQPKANAAAAAGSKRAADPVDQAGGKKKLAVAAGLRASASTSGGQEGAAAAEPNTKRTYTQDELKAKTVKELQDILKAKGMQVSGKKDVLVQRMIDFQRRQKVAAMGHPAKS